MVSEGKVWQSYAKWGACWVGVGILSQQGSCHLVVYNLPFKKGVQPLNNSEVGGFEVKQIPNNAHCKLKGFGTYLL